MWFEKPVPIPDMLFFLLIFPFCLLGCGRFDFQFVTEDASADEDRGADKDSETGTGRYANADPDIDGDAGTDIGTDTGTVTESSTDTGTDTGTSTDTGMDTGTSTDTGTDTGTSTDTGTDTGTSTDTGTDTSTDTDTGTDTSTDTDMDAGLDAGLDAGDTDTRADSLVHTIVVTTTDDTVDGDTQSIDALIAFNGADSRVSLREAILACNNTRNDTLPDEIQFDIPESGPYSIVVSSGGLPSISDAVFINGYSEPDFVSSPIIELTGKKAKTTAGLHLIAGSEQSDIRGLVINLFDGDGILIENAGENILQGNYCGLLVDGSTDAANTGSGIHLLNSASNTIGGSIVASPLESNVLSGNEGDGLTIEGAGSSENDVRGNLMGTDVQGTIQIPNLLAGVNIIEQANNNIVGGPNKIYRNVVSGNVQEGIRISGEGTNGNEIYNNYIGVDKFHTTSEVVGNIWHGVMIRNGAANNLIGSSIFTQGNVIAHNGSRGVYVTGDSTEDNAIVGNMIYSNGELGIDLGTASVTPNDTGDTDVGPNDLLNYPEITSTVFGSDEVTVYYDLDVPLGDYRIEFFENISPDGFGNGEGRLFRFSQEINHAGGVQSYTATFTFTQAEYLSATCTEILSESELGSTSEFSATVQVN